MPFDSDNFLDRLKRSNPGEDEFLQAVGDMLEHVAPVMNDNPHYLHNAVMERLTEPDRIIRFRVEWTDDNGGLHVNRGWRVQHSNAIGPYKGGLRFSPGVTLSVLKFLAFEQTFKNALTGLPLGSAKGGSDFDPKGKSDREIMRFCQAFMSELWRHIGPRTDIPAGDIGVGTREIGYMFGQYKKITNSFEGTLTGKGTQFGGAPMRAEATGYGLVHFLDHMLDAHGERSDGRTVLISGAGNVALHAAFKLADRGARPLTLSNSDGTLFKAEGLSVDDIRVIMDAQERLANSADKVGAQWRAGETPWQEKADIALPCATQNELDGNDAERLIDSGIMAVAEGANMPCTSAARRAFRKAGVLFGPAKAANAGGVALSGLEMSQNAGFRPGSDERMEAQLESIMETIHNRCMEHAGPDAPGQRADYERGANVAAFRRVADAMVAFGTV